MRKLLTIFAIFFSLAAAGQSNYITKDTTFMGWNARVTYRQGYADSTNIFIHMNGLGEVGSDTTLQDRYGPHYWMQNGWDGKVTLGNGDHYPVYVTLQPLAAYPQPQFVKPKLDAIISRFKVKSGGIAVMGLSMGGWAWLNYIYYEPTLHDHTYANQLRVVISMASVIANDNYGSDPYSWPNYFGHGALNAPNLRALAFEQINDTRAQDTEWKRMMDSTGSTSRFPFFWTNFGATNHCCFNEMCSPFQTNWTLTNADVQNSNGGAITTNPIATGQNVYQWAFRQFADTSLPDGGNILPDVDAGIDSTILFTATSISMTGTASDPDGSIISQTWSQQSGPSCTITTPTALSTTVTGMSYGTYVFRLTVVDDDGESSYDERTITNGIQCNEDAPVTYVISPTAPNEIYITNGYARGWKGGDTLLIPAGTYTVMEIDSFGGDPCNPIIIRNSGGQVIVNGSIRFKKDVHYVSIIGKDSAGITYGFKCTNFAADRVSWFTMRRIEVGPNPSGTGIYIKQDPYLNEPWNHYPAYTNRKVTIDSCHVNNVDGEGMYIGHTYPNGDPAYDLNVPQRGDSITISNCIVDSTGWDGIQLSNARDGCLIFGNTVTNFGLLDLDGQRAGIISGGNTNSKVYNNSVSNGYGNGIQFFGYGLLEAYGNTITNVGNTASHADGEQSLYSNAYLNGVETNPEQTIYLYNNTVYYPKVRGIYRADNTGSMLDTVTLENNKFCFTVEPAGTWKDDYILVPTGWTDTNNILWCPSPASGIRIRKRVKQY